MLKVKKLNSNAKLPFRASEFAAGYDLASSENCVIKPTEVYTVSTGLSVEIPEGHYGRIAGRSSLASKNYITVGGGVIDRDYRGEIKVILFNSSATNFNINVGDRIAQLILEKYSSFPVEEVDSLSDTIRGTGGFGSTGASCPVPPLSSLSLAEKKQ
jgi:dUTP pyrophosphatase